MLCEWKVIELWNVPAEELLAAGDIGLVPWVPLTQFEGPPETLLERCREQIEEQARPQERANLLAVAQIFAKLRFPQPEMLALLGGDQAMIESPLITELVAGAKQEMILEVLKTRFGDVPLDVRQLLRPVDKEKKLKQLVKHAALCPDLEAFREKLLS